METLLVNKRTAAAALSISVRGVERLIAAGDLPSVRVRGVVRIPIAALRAIAAGKEICRSKSGTGGRAPETVPG